MFWITRHETAWEVRPHHIMSHDASHEYSSLHPGTRLYNLFSTIRLHEHNNPLLPLSVSDHALHGTADPGDKEPTLL